MAALVFSVNVVTENTSKTRKSFALDCTNRFDKKYEVYFYKLRKLQKREVSGLLQFKETNGLQAAKH